MKLAHRLAVARLGAYLIDYLVLALYIAALTTLSLLLTGNNLEPVSTIEEKFRGHAIAFVTLTLPVWFYFTLQESGPKSATIGKRLVKLEVQSVENKKPSLSSIALRNGLRFLPWELSHIAIWYVPGRPFVDAMPVLNLAICLAAILVSVSYILMLFLGAGRTPYDRLSRTCVTHAQKQIGRDN